MVVKQLVSERMCHAQSSFEKQIAFMKMCCEMPIDDI